MKRVTLLRNHKGDRLLAIDSRVKLLQEKELALLKVFDKVCRENDLKYFSLGGTLLGAVRHKGFIPWDDDMDLGMPRDDYNKFLNVVSKKLPENIELIIHDNNLANTSIRDKESEFVFAGEIRNPFIDIYPLDGFPEDGLEAKIHYYKINVLRALSKLSVVDQISNRDRGVFENSLVNVAKKIKFTKLMNTEKLNVALQKQISKYDYNTSPRVGNILGRYRMKEIVNKEIIGNQIYLDFHDFKIPAPADPDKYLTNIYGDYMKLPDEKDRQGHFEIE